MKRSWEAGGAPQDEQNGAGEGSGWGGGYGGHPYATGYNTMPSFPTLESSMGAHQGGYQFHDDKRLRGNLEDENGDDDDDDDDDGDDDDVEDGRSGGGKGTPAKGKGRGQDGKPKTKLTRGSRACIPCRKIKMRCIPDDANPGGPCKRCKSGGHECVFEESNRGKRSTRKNEALAAKVAKMEAALRSIGGALSNLDQGNLNGFSTALHSATNDPDMIHLITSYTAPSAVPTLAVAMNRSPYPQSHSQDSYPYDTGGDAGHPAHPPLSPRLHSLPDNVLSPLGLLAEASLHNSDATAKRHFSGVGVGGKVHRPSPLGLDSSKHMQGRNGAPMSRSSSQSRVAVSDVRGGKSDGEDRGGVASSNYFKPGAVSTPPPAGSDERIPELLTIVNREEISKLFDIFFDHMAPHVPVVYKQFHTADLVLQRSQFLCTVICAIAARYYEKREDLHAHLSAYAKRLAFEVPSRGYKSVEVCQAYLLLSVWTLGPEKTFEQDRTWLMLGMAIRMATDLNLHRKSMVSGLDTEEGRARDLEIINRERTWLLCFILDRSISAQMGKPYTLREDYIIRNACEASWHLQRFSLPTDRALAAYAVLQQIMSRAIDSIYSSTQTISGLRNDCDYMLIVRSAHEELRRWLAEWYKPDIYTSSDPKLDYEGRAQFYYAYSSLVLYSFGLENALERAKMDISFFLLNVYEAATRVCSAVKDEFAPKEQLPYLPDTNFVMCSYALLSLLKLLKPELRPYHDYEETIFKLVSEVADLLEDVAVDPSHQPGIYAAFIREIVRKTKESRMMPNSSRAGSPTAGGQAQTIDLMNTTTGNQFGQQPSGQLYDPTLMGDWNGEAVDIGPQFTFIPQGGDMMILPSAAGPSESIQNSPSAHFPNHYTPQMSHLAHPLQHQQGNATPQTSGWAEYLPTFMSSDGFDGWDGSMLLPGFGRGQITLGGGVLHSQFGSGIITPAQHSPAVSRTHSRAQTPAGHQ